MEASEFKSRFIPYYKVLYCVAWSLTGNAQDSEDLLQDTYFKLWQKRDMLAEKFEADAMTENRIKDYLVRMMKNLFFDKLRKPDVDVCFISDTVGDVADEDSDFSDEEPDSVLEKAEENGQLMELIDRLPERERQLAMMHFVDGKDYDEIQEETGLSRVNIRQIIMRAKNRIKSQYKQIEDDGRI